MADWLDGYASLRQHVQLRWRVRTVCAAISHAHIIHPVRTCTCTHAMPILIHPPAHPPPPPPTPPPAWQVLGERCMEYRPAARPTMEEVLSGGWSG